MVQKKSSEDFILQADRDQRNPRGHLWPILCSKRSLVQISAWASGGWGPWVLWSQKTESTLGNLTRTKVYRRIRAGLREVEGWRWIEVPACWDAIEFKFQFWCFFVPFWWAPLVVFAFVGMMELQKGEELNTKYDDTITVIHYNLSLELQWHWPSWIWDFHCKRWNSTSYRVWSSYVTTTYHYLMYLLDPRYRRSRFLQTIHLMDLILLLRSTP
jgi:hypothetical protein